MLHGKAMAIVVAYDIYLELAEGNVDPAWKLDKKDIVDFYVFRETLARQKLAYNPKALKYLGDDMFRAFTSTTKAKRGRSPVPSPPTVPGAAVDGAITVTNAGVTAGALKNPPGVRLCGFIGDLTEHYDTCLTMEDKGKKLKCAFCGKPTYQFCHLCGVAVHKFPQPNVGDGVTSCFFRYHDNGCFGLARDDWRITNKKMRDWTYPTPEQLKANQQQMKALSAQVNRFGAAATVGGNGAAATVGNRGNGAAAAATSTVHSGGESESESESD
jgi:hypothetical protein